MRTLLTLSACSALLLCACAGGPPQRNSMNPNAPSLRQGEALTRPDAGSNEPSPVDPSLRRGEALVRHGAGGAELLPVVPSPAVQDLGAQAGFGRAWTSGSVRASVYLFNNYKEASAAEAWLKTHVPEGLRGDGTVNGDLLVWVTADAKDEAARAIIENLIGSFAGEE
ncbi:hypothetical protein [Corallococcus carmarthensis]|nr:hypothetical protein [Corallococcus carmarthensis]